MSDFVDQLSAIGPFENRVLPDVTRPVRVVSVQPSEEAILRAVRQVQDYVVPLMEFPTAATVGLLGGVVEDAIREACRMDKSHRGGIVRMTKRP